MQKLTYSPEWDLSTIPTETLYSELGRRRAALSHGRPPRLIPCPQCQRPAGARERRKPCPVCGFHWPSFEK